MYAPLHPLFEEELRFRTLEGPIEDDVLIGEFPLDVVDVLTQSGQYDVEFDNWYRDHWKPRQLDVLDEILAMPRNKDRYIDAKEAVSRQQAMPFVGSGMSVASGLSTWSDLLRQLHDADDDQKEALEDKLEQGDFEGAADLIADTATRQWFDEQVKHLLRLNGEKEVAGPVRILLAVFPATIVTSNLDNVLELCGSRAKAPFDSVLHGPDMAEWRTSKEPGKRYLLKLHGHHGDSGSRILTSAEYEAAYGTTGKVRDEFELLVRNNTLIFMGCSLASDRTMKCLSEIVAAEKSMAPHYAFLQYPGDEPQRRQREQFLMSHGISPIWYDGPHDECLAALIAGLLTDWEV